MSEKKITYIVTNGDNNGELATIPFILTQADFIDGSEIIDAVKVTEDVLGSVNVLTY